MNSGGAHALLGGVGASSLTSNNLSAATVAALGLTANLAESDAAKIKTSSSSSSSSSSPASFQLLQQHQQINALQQLIATQSMFNSLTPEQRMVAQQMAAETLQFNLLKDFPQSIQVNRKKILIFYFKLILNLN